jgi:hypothetical protein
MTEVVSVGRKRAHPDTSTIFVLGLLSLVLGIGLIFGISAWYFGGRLLAKYDAEPGRWGYRGCVEAGRIMGIVGTVLGVITLLVTVGTSVA